MTLVIASVFLLFRGTRPASDHPETGEAPVANIGEEQKIYAGYAGSESCRECHAVECGLWLTSNHGLAERPISAGLDRAAFEPSRVFKHGTQSTQVEVRDGQYEVVTPGYGGKVETCPAARVIGNTPLRQFLVAEAGGRWQALEAAYDPRSNQWFNVFGDEDRKPGEWGHWTGRGMNWNSSCAACHNTRLRKNYDEAADAYRTTMAEMGVGCESCHGPMKEHAQWRKAHHEAKPEPATARRMSASQWQDTCGSCHSRHQELTGDFKPGDSFFDHYSLAVPDETGTYYADGQVREEDYEFASFLGSRMCQAQVGCMDCHNPHSLKTILPDNQLCLRCHNGSFKSAPVIDPARHSFHASTSAGSRCISCHMPVTPYMQRHGRHDHGFTIPDPLLTRQLGIPNACNRCHSGQSVDWALAAVEKWHGAKMNRHTRERAQWIAAARAGEDSARDHLLSMLNGNEAPYWQTVAISLLDRWAGELRVTEALLNELKNPHPLVREKAVRALDPLVEAQRADVIEQTTKLLNDPSRCVRVGAAWTLRATVNPQSKAGRELQQMLDLAADQPGGQLQAGAYCLARHQLTAALDHFQKALAWDTNSAPIYHELAMALSLLGRGEEARQALQSACRLQPGEAQYQFELGLACAELGELGNTIEALQRAIVLNPRHAGAWYNLGLAQSQQNNDSEALTSLVRAESVDSNDPRIPYARATVLLRLGRADEARSAARRALEIQEDFTPAREFLR